MKLVTSSSLTHFTAFVVETWPPPQAKTNKKFTAVGHAIIRHLCKTDLKCNSRISAFSILWAYGGNFINQPLTD